MGPGPKGGKDGPRGSCLLSPYFPRQYTICWWERKNIGPGRRVP